MVRLLLVWLLCSGMAFAGDWEDLLRAMQKAQKVQPSGQVEVLVVFPPTGQPLKVRKDLPQLNVVPGLLRKNFVLEVQENQLVAGRSTTLYTLSPKNRLSNAWMIWVDDLWQVPVAFQQQALDGSTLRKAQYQSFQGKLLALKNQNPFRLKFNGGLETRVLQALPGLKLPRPYRVVGLRHTQFQNMPSIEIYLSDGLNTIPVVVAPRRVQQAEGVAVVSLNNQHVWVVAKMPEAELLNIIEHLTDIRTEALEAGGP